MWKGEKRNVIVRLTKCGLAGEKRRKNTGKQQKNKQKKTLALASAGGTAVGVHWVGWEADQSSTAPPSNGPLSPHRLVPDAGVMQPSQEITAATFTGAS